LKPVAEPHLQRDESFRPQYFRARVALRKANNRIVEGRGCVENQRKVSGVAR
jgi:hypothetical protein